jgi:DNA-directed RNA polymerase subunit RPC12/RpoP
MRESKASKFIRESKIGAWHHSYRFHCSDCGQDFHVSGFKRADGIDELEDTTECHCCGSKNTESMVSLNIN